MIKLLIKVLTCDPVIIYYNESNFSNSVQYKYINMSIKIKILKGICALIKLLYIFLDFLMFIISNLGIIDT